jgi:AcrR family transcriptional regulator
MASQIASPKISGSDVACRQPQRQRGRDRVASLMAAATLLFVEKGYEATTMTEIAAQAGAAIGSLYLFFPTKAALAQAMVTDLADQLSARLDALTSSTAASPAVAIADALFDELAVFLAAHPVYGVLIELPGEDGWKPAVRQRRRAQIAALFQQAVPALPADQCDRLALIVPQLMRMSAALSGEAPATRDAVLLELRTMLRRHLAPGPLS